MRASYNADAINHIKNILLARNQTIAVAESVTAGHLQVAFSQADNALNFFQGGITTYNIGQKTRHLNVNPIHAATCNCVSEQVASEMANHITSLFLSDWGIGITGYASPVPEENIEQLFACYAFSFRGKEIYRQMITAEKDTPLKVQLLYTNHVLDDFLEMLLRNEK